MPKGKRPRSKQSTLVSQYKQVRRSTRTSKKEKDVEEDAILEEQVNGMPTAKSEVQQEKLSVTEDEQELLRQFDLNPDFGPSIDITRLERWERAAKYGKSPPLEICELILKHPDNKDVSESVWSGYSL